MPVRITSRLLDAVVLLWVVAGVLGISSALARTPMNSGRLPQEFEVRAPMPRRYMYSGPGKIPIYKNRDANEWVSSIFTRIASAANLPVMPRLTDEEQRERDRREERNLPDIESERSGKKKKGSSITILEWDIVNAFATPGEKLYVTTGLLQFVDSDDELAAVISHEIAHVRLQHIEKRAKRQMVSSMLFALATISSGPEAFMAGQAASTLPVMPYGQKQELESDTVGMAYLQAAGYDPNGTIAFLRKMATLDKEETKGKGGLSTLFNTHPPTPQRVEIARRRLDELGIPEAKPQHLSYDFKMETLAVDLTDFDFQRLISGKRPQVPEGAGKVYTSMKVTGNLVPDGDFERAGSEAPLPPGWTVVKGDAAVDRAEPQQGKRSLRLTGAKGSAEVISPLIRVDPDQDYLLSGYLRSGDPHERLSLGLRYYDEKKKELRTDFPAAWKVFVPAEWTRYQGVVFSNGSNFSLPPGVGYVRVVASGTFIGPSPSWFDDLTLVKVRK